MDRQTLAKRIDHTVLGPETTLADVRRVLDEADEYGMNACIPPCYVGEAAEYAPDVTLATVVGFPHGQHGPGIKAAEAETVWDAGADEIDVVLNVGRLRAGEDDAVSEELAAVVAAVPVPVKVIVEATLLDEAELRRACEAAVEADADFVKTSTGFADGGARVADVEVMSEYLPVKASGGVGDYERAKAMFDAGAERIGASSGVAIVESFEK
ncbi:deoxyribose-phosphate aldolase [Halostella litorea]|uniref:deoxyribose-phosphate aldolase n=1 Tax=Halostella litorea TaxID=2528831 RepID=UPI001092DB2E|nr:deoxyribose-phosphate aldolase [Halostella litorea]